MRPNIIIIMSDEHNPAMCGCYGNDLIKTPNLDKLALQGTVFDNAYTTSPMCVPARMSFLTGQYPGNINVWDNGSILGGEYPTFANYLTAAGYDTVLCGRMHMLGSDRLHGFTSRIYDDMLSWTDPRQVPIRTQEARRGSNSHVSQYGPGIGSWQEYDKISFDLAERYIKGKIENPSGNPFLLVVGCMFPHFPLIAPQDFYDIYKDVQLPLPNQRHETIESQHPVIAQLRRFFANDIDLDDSIAMEALRNYYALISLVDSYTGNLVNLVDSSCLKENTVIIYLSDHGEMAGEHGIWQKQCFYEDSVRIPIITRSPTAFEHLLPNCGHVKEKVSIIDVFPTLLHLASVSPVSSLPGIRLNNPLKDRLVYSEYHAQGMLNAGYMVLQNNLKLCYYVDSFPQLFDINKDPEEITDISDVEEYQNMKEDLIRLLYDICTPEEMDVRCKKDQNKRLIKTGKKHD